MNLNDVKSFPTDRKKRRVKGRGDGSKRGNTSGRGQKGDGSRSGHRSKIFYEGGQMPLFRRLPKRGFSNALFKRDYSILNVGDLNEFPQNTVINLEKLQEIGSIKDPKNGLKILGTGELTVALTIEAKAFSKSAREKIEKAGGKAKEI
ncbi:MAG: 50S ribosomal protein L15 [Planctomycetota bacterium]